MNNRRFLRMGFYIVTAGLIVIGIFWNGAVFSREIGVKIEKIKFFLAEIGQGGALNAGKIEPAVNVPVIAAVRG